MNQNLIDNENLQSDREKLQHIKKPKTNGDVIRKSNEKLAEFLTTPKGGCECCIAEPHTNLCDSMYCKEGILKYFNQPIESKIIAGIDLSHSKDMTGYQPIIKTTSKPPSTGSSIQMRRMVNNNE